MTIKQKKSTLFIFLLTFLIYQAVYAQDTFKFNAPPGAVYLNSSFERTSTEIISITVDHKGAAVPQWFITADKGNSTVYEPRKLVFASNTMDYQIYKDSGLTEVIKAPLETLNTANVISNDDFSAHFSTYTDSMEQQTYNLFFYIDSGLFISAGTYSDTITLNLYTGDYADSGTHVKVDTVNVTIYGRMAKLLDIYSIHEPGIRFMDLTGTQTDKLIATVNERSNSATGYTVSITSRNLSNDISGAIEPYFLHSDEAGTLPYSLNYDGAAVGPWSSGTAQLTDYAGTTAPGWFSKEIDISYSGSSALPAGDYEDILTLTISAK